MTHIPYHDMYSGPGDSQPIYIWDKGSTQYYDEHGRIEFDTEQKQKAKCVHHWSRSLETLGYICNKCGETLDPYGDPYSNDEGRI